jgi:hypothetical protein
MIHAGMAEELRDCSHLIKLVGEEPGMTGHFLRPLAMVIDYDHGYMRAGIDVFRPSLVLG